MAHHFHTPSGQMCAISFDKHCHLCIPDKTQNDIVEIQWAYQVDPGPHSISKDNFYCPTLVHPHKPPQCVPVTYDNARGNYSLYRWPETNGPMSVGSLAGIIRPCDTYTHTSYPHCARLSLSNVINHNVHVGNALSSRPHTAQPNIAITLCDGVSVHFSSDKIDAITSTPPPI